MEEEKLLPFYMLCIGFVRSGGPPVQHKKFRPPFRNKIKTIISRLPTHTHRPHSVPNIPYYSLYTLTHIYIYGLYSSLYSHILAIVYTKVVCLTGKLLAQAPAIWSNTNTKIMEKVYVSGWECVATKNG